MLIHHLLLMKKMNLKSFDIALRACFEMIEMFFYVKRISEKFLNKYELI